MHGLLQLLQVGFKCDQVFPMCQAGVHRHQMNLPIVGEWWFACGANCYKIVHIVPCALFLFSQLLPLFVQGLRTNMPICGTIQATATLVGHVAPVRLVY